MREGWLILSCGDFTEFSKLKPNTLHRCDKPIYIPLIELYLGRIMDFCYKTQN